MLPSGYEFLDEGTSLSEGPYAVRMRFFQGARTYGYRIDAADDTASNLPPLECTGFGFRSMDDANAAALMALKNLLASMLFDPRSSVPVASL